MVIGIRFTHHAAISVLQLYDQREQRHTASYTVSPTWCLDVRMNTLLTLADHARRCVMCSACHICIPDRCAMFEMLACVAPRHTCWAISRDHPFAHPPC